MAEMSEFVAKVWELCVEYQELLGGHCLEKPIMCNWVLVWECMSGVTSHAQMSWVPCGGTPSAVLGLLTAAQEQAKTQFWVEPEECDEEH